jgi:hypothetical protein
LNKIKQKGLFVVPVYEYSVKKIHEENKSTDLTQEIGHLEVDGLGLPLSHVQE